MIEFNSKNYSNIEMEIQLDWLRKVLEENDNRWTIITFHHPLYSPASDRDNLEMRQLWKPLLDEFKVELVQGSGGVFEVTVNNALTVFSKRQVGRFPKSSYEVIKTIDDSVDERRLG